MRRFVSGGSGDDNRQPLYINNNTAISVAPTPVDTVKSSPTSIFQSVLLKIIRGNKSMHKKLLPAMIGALLAGGMSAATADVSLFGHIDAAYIGIDQDGGSDDTVFRCTTCSIGFKGSEDLGNGLKAIFSLDFQYNIFERNTVGPTTTTTSLAFGTGAITDRDQWLGLAGGFGKIRMGTISTGYKSHGAMIDPLYRTALQGRDRGLQSSFHRGAGEELQGRATNTVRWDSVDYSGVKLVAHYTLDSNENNGEDDNPFGVGASYSNDSMLVFRRLHR